MKSRTYNCNSSYQKDSWLESCWGSFIFCVNSRKEFLTIKKKTTIFQHFFHNSGKSVLFMGPLIFLFSTTWKGDLFILRRLWSKNIDRGCSSWLWLKSQLLRKYRLSKEGKTTLLISENTGVSMVPKKDLCPVIFFKKLEKEIFEN